MLWQPLTLKLFLWQIHKWNFAIVTNSNVNSLGDRVLPKGFGSKCMGFRTAVLEYNEDVLTKF